MKDLSINSSVYVEPNLQVQEQNKHQITIQLRWICRQAVTNSVARGQLECVCPQWWSIADKLKIISLSFSGIGFSLRPLNLSKDYIMLISYPGELFMRVLKLMILPLIISSLIAGSASLNARMNGKIALRTLIYFASTSFFNACLGIFLVLLIHPGDPGLHSDSPSGSDNKNVNLLDSLLDLGRWVLIYFCL